MRTPVALDRFFRFPPKTPFLLRADAVPAAGSTRKESCSNYTRWNEISKALPCVAATPMTRDTESNRPIYPVGRVNFGEGEPDAS